MIDLDQKIRVSNTKANIIHRRASVDHNNVCHYCLNGRTTNIIRISDLRVGIETGCTVCWALSRGIIQLRASLLGKDLQLFNNLAGIVLITELKQRETWMRPLAENAVLPLDIYVDAGARCGYLSPPLKIYY